MRQAEQFVVASKAGAPTPAAARKRIEATTPATQKLSEVLHAPVSLKRTAKGGQLMIAYKNDDDLSRIIKQLS